MEKFKKHTGLVLPLNISNIDTDAIIPKQFLKKLTKTGFGENLFHNWRYTDKNGKNLNKSFILNKKEYKNASIILTRENFGCGSSREHAVWALKDYGFKVVISSSFSDIFYNNSINNCLIPIILEKKKIDLLFKIVMNNKILCSVNLKKNIINIKKYYFKFEIDEYKKYCLMNGLDNIDITLKYLKHIKKYEKKIPVFFS
ncbi:3-isopropylmalate dehydratase small subunit (plasmid) [Buchnera aphidicola (Mollitrichosiphum nigrofasciatum)]|uniref:3-isopropylmalate dehydratase small subunit n=1 Tax=Buchnera aphidicola TaxID=9 RepID=UPI0031B86211